MAKILNINLKGVTKNVETRLETLQEIEYIVAPVTMIVEGVLPGSAGPILYTANELAASVAYWDGVPVTINHPTDANGNNVSARIPSIIAEFGVGTIYNTHFDAATNSLKAEAWINKSVLENKFPDVHYKILSNTTNIEVSTGVFFDDRQEPGNFNDVSYNSVAYSYHGDHLALLPDAIGACSWTDGCGLRANQSTQQQKPERKKHVFNELSFSDITSTFNRHVDGLDDAEYIYYVDAIYDGFFVFERFERNEERQKTLWRQQYSKVNDVITVTGEPSRVVETRVYTVVSEDAQQPSGTPAITNKKDSDMAETNENIPCCPEKVQSLIAAANNAFTEADKDNLLSMNEAQLESTIAMSERIFSTHSAETDKADDADTEMTVSQYVEKAPEKIKVALNTLLVKEETEKQSIISNLLKDENCTFEKEELNAFSVNMLTKMAGLAKTSSAAPEASEQENNTADMSANAAGSTDAVIPGTTDELTDEQTLKQVSINWKK